MLDKYRIQLVTDTAYQGSPHHGLLDMAVSITNLVCFCQCIQILHYDTMLYATFTQFHFEISLSLEHLTAWGLPSIHWQPICNKKENVKNGLMCQQ